MHSCICIYIHIDTKVHMYVCLYMSVYVCTYVYVCVYVYACMCVCMYVRSFPNTYNICLRGEMSRGKCPTQNARVNCPG